VPNKALKWHFGGQNHPFKKRGSTGEIVALYEMLTSALILMAKKELESEVPPFVWTDQELWEHRAERA